MNNKQFAEEVLKTCGNGDEFKPTATYIPEGDCIEIVFAPHDYYAKRINAQLTVYHNRDTDQVVGVLLKGVAKLLGEKG